MIYIVVLMGLLFIGTGLLLTKSNASTLLAGYNTMSEKDRSQYDISAYLSHFKRFHLQLGITFVLGGLIIYMTMAETVLGIFMAFYPIVAYLYFFYKTRHIMPNPPSSTASKWGIGVLAIILIGLTALFYFGMSEDDLSVENKTLIIGGTYGETISKKEIQSVELVENRPKIKLKVNGFSLGEQHKGYYKTSDGKKVKLIINAKNPPYIKITKIDGLEIYYSKSQYSNADLYHSIINDMDLY